MADNNYNLLEDEGVAVAPPAAANLSPETSAEYSLANDPGVKVAPPRAYSLTNDPGVKPAPLTPEQLTEKVFSPGSTYEPTPDEVAQISEYQKNKPGPGFWGRAEQFGNAAWETGKHFVKSAIEGAKEYGKTAVEHPEQLQTRGAAAAAEAPLRAFAQVPGMPVALGALNLQRALVESIAKDYPPEVQDRFKIILHKTFLDKLRLQRAMEGVSEGRDSLLNKIAEGVGAGELPEAAKPISGAAEVLQLGVPMPGGAAGQIGRRAAIRAAIEGAEQGPGIASRVLRAGETAAGGVEKVAGLPQDLATKVVEGVLGKSKEAERLSKLAGLGAWNVPVLGAIKKVELGASGTQKTLEFFRRLSETGESSVPGLLQLANDEAAPNWIRSLAGGLYKTGIAAPIGRGIARAAKGAVEGAAVGAGLGALTGEGPDTITSYAGGGAAVGAGMRLLHPQSAYRKYQAQQGDLGDFYLHLKEQGTPEETMLKLPDDVALQAATFRANFHGKLNFRVLDGPAYDQAVKGQGGEGTAGFFNRADNTIYLNTDASRPALTHEVGHALMRAVGADGEARLAFDTLLGPEGLRKAREDYARKMELSARAAERPLFPGQSRGARLAALQREFNALPPEVQQAAIERRAQMEDQRNKGPNWVYDELYADAGYGLLAGRNVHETLFPSVWEQVKQKARETFFQTAVPKAPEGALFSNINIYSDPQIRRMLREHFRQVREGRAGVGIEKETKEGVPQPIPVAVESLGMHPAAPAEMNPVTGRRENDFFVIEQDGRKTLRTQGEVRQIERTRQAEVAAAFPDRTPLPREDRSTAVATRVTPSGKVLKLGTQISPQLERLVTFGPRVKEIAKTFDQAIATGEGQVFDLWYQAAATGAKYRWARDLKTRLANIAASQVKFAPFEYQVDKAGNILAVGLSLTAADRKLAKWALTRPEYLRPWGGNTDAFKADLMQYLKNHAEGRPGFADERKKNILNVFVIGDNRAYHDLNPLRDTLRGEDKGGIIRSLRLDRIATVEAAPETGWQGEYGKKVLNYSPEAVAEPQREWIKTAAIQTRDGKIYTGFSHFNAMENMHIARGWDPHSGESWGTGEPLEFGYLTSEGRFVDREEGMRIAEGQNQVQRIGDKVERRGYGPEELISEEVTDFNQPGDVNAPRPEPRMIGPEPDVNEGVGRVLTHEEQRARAREKPMPGQPMDFSPEMEMGSASPKSEKDRPANWGSDIRPSEYLPERDTAKQFKQRAASVDLKHSWRLGKFPWMVDKDYFRKVRDKEFPANENMGNARDYFPGAHRNWVMEALRQGLDVPTRIAHEYPTAEWLQGQIAKKAEPGEVGPKAKQVSMGLEDSRKVATSLLPPSGYAKAGPEGSSQRTGVNESQGVKKRVPGLQMNLEKSRFAEKVPEDLHAPKPAKLGTDEASGLPSVWHDPAQDYEDTRALIEAKGTARKLRAILVEMVREKMPRKALSFDREAAKSLATAVASIKDHDLFEQMHDAERLVEMKDAEYATARAGIKSPRLQKAFDEARKAVPILPEDSELGQYAYELASEGSWPGSDRFAKIDWASEGPVFWDRKTNFVYKLQEPESFYLGDIVPNSDGEEGQYGLVFRKSSLYDTVSKIDRMARIAGGLPVEIQGIVGSHHPYLLLKMPKLERDATTKEFHNWMGKYGTTHLNSEVARAGIGDRLIPAVGHDQPVVHDQHGNYYVAGDARQRKDRGTYPNFMVDDQGRTWMIDVMLRPIDEKDIKRVPGLGEFAPAEPKKILYSPEVSENKDWDRPVDLSQLKDPQAIAHLMGYEQSFMPGGSEQEKVAEAKAQGLFSPEAIVGVSPNIDEGLSSGEVVKRLRADEAARFRSVLRDEASKLGFKAVPRYAYGVWKDGAENSFSVFFPDIASMDDLKKYAARAGLEGYQKGVIAFLQRDGGTARLARFDVPKGDDWGTINKVMQANGIAYSTIIPNSGGGHTIEIVDTDGTLGKSVGNVLQHYGIPKGRGEVIEGDAEFIGGNTRAEGRREYQRVLGDRRLPAPAKK